MLTSKSGRWRIGRQRAASEHGQSPAESRASSGSSSRVSSGKSHNAMPRVDAARKTLLEGQALMADERGGVSAEGRGLLLN